MLTLTMLISAFNIQPVRAKETIFIRADGSVAPPTAPLQRDGDIYTLTTSVNGSLVIEKDNIVFDGANNTLQGSSAFVKGIDLSGRNNVTVKNLEIKGFLYGIYLNGSSNDNTLSGNNIVNNSITYNEFGIFEWIASNSLFADNQIAYNKYGVSLWQSSNNVFTHNNIVNNAQYGISLMESSDYNTVTRNNIANNSDTGISLWRSSGNTITANTITIHSHGISFYHWARYNALEENNLTKNKYGVFLWDLPNYNTLTSNWITNNENGILLYRAYNNVIFHNNFVNNTIQATVIDIFYNSWDNGYPSGGNFWSHYNGTDLKSGSEQDQPQRDGIGDTPYIMAVNNRDRYPLMRPWKAGLRDISVTSVSLSTNETYVGKSIDVTMIVENKGNTTETFVLTYKYVLDDAEHSIGTILIESLPPKTNKTITGSWTTTTIGVHLIKGEVSILPNETNVNDNNLTSPNAVKVKMLGDVDGDNQVSIRDLSAAARAYGSYLGHPRWNMQADITQDGIVDIRDLVLIAKNFGKTWNNKP